MKKYFIATCIFGMLLGTYTWVQSADNTLRIVALGDSITYGTGDPEKKGYIHRLQSLLVEEKNVHARIYNYAVPKYTTEDILAQLNDKEKLQQIRKADRLILFVGTNDLRRSASYQFQQLNLKEIHNGKKVYLKNLQHILEIVRMENNDAPIYVLGLFHPYVQYENEKEIQLMIEDWNNDIEDTIGSFKRTHFVPTIDLFLEKRKADYFSDSLHPNPKGYKLIADRLVNVIMESDTSN